MRSRPYVSMRLPKVIHPGDDIEVNIHLESASAGTPIDSARLTFSGYEGAWVGEDNRILYRSRPIVADSRELAKKIHLEAHHHLRATFRVPREAHASYRGSRITVSYELALAIVIPWWLDVHESHEVVVTAPSCPRPPRAPLVSRSATRDGPFIEVSLDDVVYGCGEILEGAFAVGNLGDRRMLGADISIVGIDHVRLDGQAAETESQRISLHAVLNVAEGRPHTFRLRIPRDAPVSFQGALASLAWALEVRIELRGTDLIHQVPIVITHLVGDAGLPPDPRARPAIGQQRWRAGWRTVADQHGLTLAGDALRLTGSLAQADVVVAPGMEEGHRGGLSADLRWTSWGLGVRVVKRRLALFGEGDSEPAFRRRFLVRGREPVQVRELLFAPLRQALLAFDEVHLVDDHVRVRSRRLGPDEPELQAFVARLVVLARALEAASLKVPPPAAMEAFVPAWRAFAGDVGARFQMGRMALLDARIEGEPFDVATVFEADPEPRRTLVRLSHQPGWGPGSSAARESPHVATDAEAIARLPAGTREAIAALERKVMALRIDPFAVEVELEGPIADPATLRPLFLEMLALPWIRGERTQGPYR